MSARARRFFGCVLPLALAVLGCVSCGLLAYAGQVIIQLVPVREAAMSPVLEPGWTVLVNNAAFWAREPEYGSIASIAGPRGPRFRRVYGRPGDEIEIRDGEVYIDGEPSRVMSHVHGDNPDFGPITLGPNEYFVLAEDRSASDSRTWGPIAREDLYGNAMIYFLPGSTAPNPVDPTPTPVRSTQADEPGPTATPATATASPAVPERSP